MPTKKRTKRLNLAKNPNYEEMDAFIEEAIRNKTEKLFSFDHFLKTGNKSSIHYDNYA